MVKYLLWAWPIGILLFTVHVIFACVPALILRLVGLKKIADKWVYSNMSLVSNLLFKIIGVNVNVSGSIKELDELRKSGAKICYVSNHTSMLDILLIEGPLSLNCGFILKSQLAKVPIVNIIAITLNSVFIDRSDIKRGAKSIMRGKEKIERGNSMLIFPEGTRSKTGKIAPFKHGSFKLATLSNSYVVPVTIKGIRKAFEDRDKCFKHVECYLNIGDAVKTEGLNREETWNMVEEVEASIRKVYGNLPE